MLEEKLKFTGFTINSSFSEIFADSPFATDILFEDSVINFIL